MGSPSPRKHRTDDFPRSARTTGHEGEDPAWDSARKAEERGDWDVAGEHFAVIAAREGIDPRQKATALLHAGRAHRFLGDGPTAASLARQALDIARPLGDEETSAHALLLLGYLHWRKGDQAGAQDFFEDALRVAKALDDELLLALCHQALGDYWSGRWANPKALTYYDHASRLLSDAGAWFEWVRLQTNCAMVHLQQGQYAEAIAMLEEALPRTDPADSSLPRAWVLVVLGEAYARAGRTKDSEGMLREAGRRIEVTSSPVLKNTYEAALGQLDAAKGDFAGAVKRMRSALPAVRKAGALQDQVLLLLDIGRIQRRAGDAAGVKTTVAEARKLLDEDDLPLMRATLDELLR